MAVANWWFACDVKAAMLVVKYNSLSLHPQEAKLYFMQILRQKMCIVLSTSMAALSRGWKQKYI